MTLKIYFEELKRIYNIIFENRPVDDIRKDYYNNKWISKSELEKLLTYETTELTKMVLVEREMYNSLLEGFNLSAMKNAQIYETRALQAKKSLKV